MIEGKYITKIAVVFMAAAVVLCLTAMVFSDELTEALGGTGVSQEYESKLFDVNEIASVDILMDEDKWQEMLDNATDEVYYQCDVVINGTTFYSVGIRPKGNTSLTAIAADPDNDRYSFKLEFDHFVDGQTCWGLDKLILNNNYSDATNMKEAVVYDMYQYLDVDSSLYNYAEISVNGSYWGVYLALEAVEDSFLLRNYGVRSGEMYKPDSMDMGGGQGDGGIPGGFSGFDMPGGFDAGSLPEGFDAGSMPEGFDAGSMPEGFDAGSLPEGFDAGSMPEGLDAGSLPEGFDPSSMNGGSGKSTSAENSSDSSSSGSGDGEDGKSSDTSAFDFSSFGGGGGGFSQSGGGANLNYIDDELDSYSTIWEGEVTNTSKSDHRRVVTALKNVSEGTELETYMDVDNILKYMAVHSFVVNEDSLTGSMAHNYYLYEYDGQLNILPWDYNLAFGGMGSMGGGMGGSGGADSMVNDPIDTPFSGTKFFDSLLENEEYLARYHEYYRQLVEEYVFGGGFEETYTRIRSQIDSLVKTDPNAMYTYEEYEAATEMFYDTVMLRGKSVEGQLDGTIPSTDEGQRADSSALIDASSIDIETMGVFSMGGFGGFGGFGGGGDSGSSSQAGVSGGETPAEKNGNAGNNMTEEKIPDGEQLGSSGRPAGFTPMQSGSGSAGEAPEGFDGEMPEGFDGKVPEGFDGEIPEGFNGKVPEGIDEKDQKNNTGESTEGVDGKIPEGVDERGSEGNAGETTEGSDREGQEDIDEKVSESNAGETTKDSGRKAPEGFAGGFGVTGSTQTKENLIWFSGCFVLLLLALLFAKLYHRRRKL